MTDRELLELAAKAAGVECLGDLGWRLPCGQSQAWWNPLTDDGDALRLAVKLGLTASIETKTPLKGRTMVWTYGVPKIQERHWQDPCAATRLAIVRAAAEIGKQPASH